jgi:2-(1,2-epoxy-1,2-dihydrophenyl)acetyl-CoA isomerase
MKDLVQHNDFFDAQRVDDAIFLTIGGHILLSPSDQSLKQQAFDYLDLVESSQEIKVVVLKASPEVDQCKQFDEFFCLLADSRINESILFRMFRAYDQFILKIMKSRIIYIAVINGDVPFQTLNMGLAADYRIFAENTVVHNLSMKLGLAPEGAGAFLLERILGPPPTLELMLSNDGLTASQAHVLGIAQRVVPVDELETAAIECARDFASKPAAALALNKRLLNSDLGRLEKCLELETQELAKILKHTDGWKQSLECE